MAVGGMEEDTALFTIYRDIISRKIAEREAARDRYCGTRPLLGQRMFRGEPAIAHQRLIEAEENADGNTP